MPEIIGNSSTLFSGFCGQAHRGEICRQTMETGRTPTEGFVAGETEEYGKNSLKSCLLGPSQISAKLDNGEVLIREKTAYPFEDSIHYVITTNTPFTLSIRIPRFEVNLGKPCSDNPSSFVFCI